ncbi:hypothetical protein AB1Y20_019487 [Prymnesium parvum]|uniref:Uncharacterized protein n=1 Tax=Prymnesium parvum TaxID=97485 RepID=A0AB34JRA1_PRYPA
MAVYSGAPYWAGDSRVPFALLQSTLDPPVLDYLQRQVGSSLGAQLLHNARSAGRVPGHTSHQLFLHGLPSPSEVHTPGGPLPERRAAAPPALRALLECLRRTLAPRLAASLASADDDFSRLVRAMLAAGGLFADVDVQFHAGAHVPPAEAYWHVDMPNSFAHLGISLFGSRTLHAKCGRRCNVSATEQRAGRVYLSSPAAFEHGVEYPRHAGGSLGRSIVAVQARLLVRGDNVSSRRLIAACGKGTMESRGAVDAFARLAAALDRGPPLALPSLAELRAVERSLLPMAPPSRRSRSRAQTLTRRQPPQAEAAPNSKWMAWWPFG